MREKHWCAWYPLSPGGRRILVSENEPIGKVSPPSRATLRSSRRQEALRGRGVGIQMAGAVLGLRRGPSPGVGPQKQWRHLGTDSEDLALDSSPGCTAYKLGDPNDLSLVPGLHAPLLKVGLRWQSGCGCSCGVSMFPAAPPRSSFATQPSIPGTRGGRSERSGAGRSLHDQAQRGKGPIQWLPVNQRHSPAASWRRRPLYPY